MFLGVKDGELNVHLSLEGVTKLENAMELLKSATLEFLYVRDNIQGVVGINIAENIDSEMFQDYYKLQFLLDSIKKGNQSLAD